MSCAPLGNDYFVHPNALCESHDIGFGTRIWAFAHVLAGASIGSDCNICDQVFIESDVKIGDRVTVKCGVQLWDGLRIGDDVFIGPNATFTNDRFPRSKQYPQSFPVTEVSTGASIGANATILPGIKIGAGAMVGAGAVVLSDVPANAIVVGNPAKIVGYVNTLKTPGDRLAGISQDPGCYPTQILGVNLHRLPQYQDMRGRLCVGEFDQNVPFPVERFFMVYGVPSAEVRGEHAHRRCHQFLIAARGSVSVVADDGSAREEYLLDDPSLAVHLPPGIWGVQYRYSADALLLVFASHRYDSGDYIRNYDDFLREFARS